MNNENEMNNMEPTVAPSVPDPVGPNPMGMPDPVQPAPVEIPDPVGPSPVEPAPMGVAEPVGPSPIGGPDLAQPASPVGMTEPAPGTNPSGMGEEPKKKSNLGLIIIIVVVVLVGLGVGAYFMFGDKEEEDTTDNGGNNNNSNTQTTTKADEEFLELAKKYVAAAEKMWNDNNMLCQNSIDQTTYVKPSELSEKDTYEGNAEYFIFIDTANSNEIKLNVENNKAVSGWVRVVKATNTFYVALSDGTNYIVDRGPAQTKKASELTKSDVVTTGNGNNYQYKNENIFGSQTEDNGWGIGDYKISTDGDTSNDGIYMDNGKKDGGYSPFCKNVE